jgi:FkbM family methyltransferase
MTMISYAQNAEDVLLSRLFPPGRPGFYIDVGANDPVVDSVTKHFYDLGWRGINVEPSSRPFERLLQQRDRDVNLNVGLSDKEGSLSFYEFPPELPGSSTFEHGQAEWHHDSGRAYEKREVPVTTLARICEEHVTGTVDFLTIDTEGHERQVLEGGDWARWRPRVVVVEATQPNTLIPTHDQWEHVLTGAGYLFAAFDGLNRFYVRAEDEDLLPALAAPANVLDDFVPFRYSKAIAELRARVSTAENHLAAARVLNDALRNQFGHLPGQLAWFRAQYEALEGALRTHREQYATVRAALAELEGLYVRLEADTLAAAAQTEELRQMFQGVGPGTLAIARRLTSTTERYPAAKHVARRLVRAARSVRRAGRGSPA